MAFAAGFGRQANRAISFGTAVKDPEVTSPPEDAVSSLCFSPAAQLLAATSWDNKVSCWEVGAQGQTAPKAAISHSQPVLCSAWAADGGSIFAGKVSEPG